MTDKAKMYAVKNDEGEWMSLDGTQTGIWYSNNPTLFKDKSYAEAQSMGLRAHVVELLEAPAKVVVSEEEAEILKKLDREIRTKSTGYSPWKWLSKLDDLGMAVEDAYKALAIGWTVEKPKRWNVKVPHTKDVWYYKAGKEYLLTICPAGKKLRGKFTESEIKHYGLQDCELEEVKGYVK
ncbi:DUF1642 domain-containing protein [Lacticaseibacillus sp. 53-4]|uniref:DUF1642 domain-containing protein n=1 Tax=Lacticaseibacillus sp. 53-4 TaxID=2799575 RepID=UPI001944EDA5|nr:DUF1642 domain-containing protein [Lacticaseibacillus sp. 53-4]